MIGLDAAGRVTGALELAAWLRPPFDLPARCWRSVDRSETNPASELMPGAAGSHHVGLGDGW